MTDPIADMITRIKNAYMASHDEVSVPHSKMKEAVARILEQSGYVESVSVTETVPQKTIVIGLKYVGRAAAITDVRRISKPGRRLYASAKQIPRALGGYGITIVSTSKGIMTDDTARKQNVGGELVCQVW